MMLGREVVACVAVCATFGCTDGMRQSLAPELAIRFQDGSGNYLQHLDNKLPGLAPVDGGVATAAAGGAAGTDTGPTVDYETAPGFAFQGQANAKFAGKLSNGAVTIGMAMSDVAPGYWVRPAGDVDPQTKAFTWSASLDISDSVEAGYHDVTFVGVDENGTAGQQIAFPLCIKSRVPDNFNACEPSADAPAAIISLKWDTNVDLDLQVIDPDGNVIDSKHRSTTPVGSKVDPNAGVIDRDSNGSCVIDGIRYENLVWNKTKPSGRYGIYVNLFDSCKQPAVHFEVSVWEAQPVADAGKKLKQYYSQSGELMDFQANGGDGRGLFVSEFVFK